MALVEACQHLRDRFLVVLLAETGMRIGQALGLRHADFISHRRELRIVPRPDNANGARAKTSEVTTIPISAGLVRLYTAYMFDEYGETDSDYVFVNLSAPRGALTYPLRSREGLEVISLGPMAYLASKEKGDNSMPSKPSLVPRRTGRGDDGPARYRES